MASMVGSKNCKWSQANVLNSGRTINGFSDPAVVWSWLKVHRNYLAALWLLAALHALTHQNLEVFWLLSQLYRDNISGRTQLLDGPGLFFHDPDYRKVPYYRPIIKSTHTPWKPSVIALFNILMRHLTLDPMFLDIWLRRWHKSGIETFLGRPMDCLNRRHFYFW